MQEWPKAYRSWEWRGVELELQRGELRLLAVRHLPKVLPLPRRDKRVLVQLPLPLHPVARKTKKRTNIQFSARVCYKVIYSIRCGAPLTIFRV